jgi:hypothetical protein
MVAHGVFLDVMKIVKFHHRGHLDSFAYGRFMRVCRARYLLDRCDFQVSGIRDETGYAVDDDFEPAEVSDPRGQIRLLDPYFTAGGSIYDVILRVNYVDGLACQALGQEDELWLSFCLEAYRILLIEDGFRLAPRYEGWCDIRQRCAWCPMSLDDCFTNGFGSSLPCMRGRRATYAAWTAKVRA